MGDDERAESTAESGSAAAEAAVEAAETSASPTGAPEDDLSQKTDTKATKAKEPKPPRDLRDLLLRTAAALACATCMVLGSPDASLWWLGLFGWLPWLWLIDGRSPRSAFWFGWLAGTVTVFWGFIWISELLTRFAGFDALPTLGLHLLFSAFQGLQWAIPAAVLAAIQRRTGRELLFIAPLAWCVGEALLPHVFPSYLALMWCWQPLWLQTAELGGVCTVGLVMLSINSGLYCALKAWIRERRVDRRALALFLGVLIGAPTYGAIRMAQIDALAEASPKVKVGVVQGNFGITQWSHPRYKGEILRRLQRESARLESQGAELILWGETAYPYSRAIPRQNARDLPEKHPRRVRQGFSAPLIFGLVTDDRTTSRFPWNTAMVLNADGSVGDIYDKNYPLAFGEYIPLVDPEWYLEMVPAASYINPGNEPKALGVGDYRFGPLICYEDILPRFARDIANQRISAFVNLTNDSWFGKTKEQYQHLGLAVLRTIENRRPLLRAVNAGVSAYVDPNGRMILETEVTDPDVDGLQDPVGFVAEVPMIDPEYRTPYSYFGEGLNTLALIGLVILGLRPPRRREQAR
ncbi:MAG: apolipoprotein N-acyltransferase [Myxococcales bacterium]|nr:apolipoprotein N-acyltransferase [Myxococcales bacterium]